MGSGGGKPVKSDPNLKFDPPPPRHKVSADDRKKTLEELAKVIATKRIDYVGTGVAPMGKENENLMANIIEVFKYFPDAALTIQCVTGGAKKNDGPSQKRGESVKKKLLEMGFLEMFPIEVTMLKDKLDKAAAKTSPKNGFVKFLMTPAATEYDPFRYLELVKARKQNRIVVDPDFSLGDLGKAAVNEVFVALRDVQREVVVRSCDFSGDEGAARKRGAAVQAHLTSLGLLNTMEVVTEKLETRTAVGPTESLKKAGYEVTVSLRTDAEFKERADAAEAQAKLEEEARKEELAKQEAEMEPTIVIEDGGKKTCTCCAA